ncbi:MAG: lipopolysaccharide biosynthesis protein [Chloroflexota bacterium]|nr:lipopolysaccharide biosynthesis protein [Chloroflexota bacterium]
MMQRLFRSKFVRDTLTLQVGKVIATGLAALSTLLVLRLLGPEEYGRFALAQSFMALWVALDLTGIGSSINTHLGVAIGKRDADAVLDALAVFLKIAFVVTLAIIALIATLGQPLAQLLHADAGDIGRLALLLAFTLPADYAYALAITSFQSRRQMRTVAIAQSLNQLILTLCTIAAVLMQARAESLIMARLVYSYSTMLGAWLAYARLRGGETPFPTIGMLLRRAWSVAPRPYLRFGFLNAVDKNLSNQYTQLPLQLVGILVGERAAGYLSSALALIAQAGVLTSAVFDNMQAVVPQMVGERDFARLRRNFGRVLRVLLVGGVVLYAIAAAVAPFALPLLLGSEWANAVPAFMVLAIYGALTTFGGIFGPLYRALDLIRPAIAAKIAALVIALPLGYWLISSSALAGITTAALPGEAVGALGGAWTIVLLFAISVGLTAIIGLRGLNAADDTRLPQA